MARPRNADAAGTKARLIAVATAHFGRDGFRAATVRAIAGDAGVTFATVHHHFGTKEALFGACVEAAFDDLMGLGREIVAILATAPRTERIASAVRHAFRAALAARDRSRFLLRTFVFEDPDLTSAHVPSHRKSFIEGALALTREGEDRDDRLVRLVGIGMLVTRLAATSAFEHELLGGDAYQPGGSVERYLIQVAENTLSEDVADIVEVPR
jgi:AcrR family transcriptional regulator